MGEAGEAPAAVPEEEAMSAPVSVSSVVEDRRSVMDGRRRWDRRDGG